MDTKSLVISLCIASAITFGTICYAADTSTNNDVDFIDRNCGIRFNAPQALFHSVTKMDHTAEPNRAFVVSSDGSLKISCELDVNSNIDSGYLKYQNQSNATVTYKTKKENWFVVSGTKGDEIFYSKGKAAPESKINGQKSLTVVTAEYKYKDKNNLNPIVTRIMASTSLTSPQVPGFVEIFLRQKYDLEAESILDSDGYDIDERNGNWRYWQEQSTDNGGMAVSAGYHFLFWSKSDGGKVVAVTEYSSYDNGEEPTTFWSYDHGKWSELHDVIPPLQFSDFWDSSKGFDKTFAQCCIIGISVPDSNKEHISANIQPVSGDDVNYKKFVKNTKYESIELVWDSTFNKLLIGNKNTSR